MGIKLIKKTNEAAYTAIKNPEQAFSSTVEEDEDGRKLSH